MNQEDFRNRTHLLILFLVTMICIQTILRVVLAAAFWSDIRPGLPALVRCFFAGFRLDAMVMAWAAVPFWLWLLLIPEKQFGTAWHRTVIWSGFVIAEFLCLLLSVLEYCYFGEFNSRFDFIAVYYLIYPYEIFVNMWESFPVVQAIGGALIASILLVRILAPLIRRALDAAPVVTFRPALLAQGLIVILGTTLTTSTRTSVISTDRALNEVASSGIHSFFHALWEQDLDYHHYYPTLPADEAFLRLKKYYEEPDARFVAESPNPLEREILPEETVRRMNVVIIIEESLGMELLGPQSGETVSLTPEIDRLAGESLFFTNFYATGNRTARGLEAILASFPPIPGKAIPHRKHSHNISTIASTLRDAGYHTLFVYGGRGVFDGVGAFTRENGFERFLERKDYNTFTHKTVWGVCDEDIFHKALAECDALSKTGQPFLCGLLTSSNHRPFTYPQGRVPYDPDKKARHHAVAYADWAVGDFFREIKKRDYYSNTLFVLLGDHGPRVSGSENVPLRSYEIPLVIHAPKLFPQGRRISTLGCSMDVAPTILDILGIPYRSVFYGQDILGTEKARNFILMSHNLDVAWFDGKTMIEMGIPKTTRHFRYDTNSRTLTKTEASPELSEALKDAIAFFQTANDLYYQELYRITKHRPENGALVPSRPGV